MCHFFWPCRVLSCLLTAVLVRSHPLLLPSCLHKSREMPKHGPKKAGDEVKSKTPETGQWALAVLLLLLSHLHAWLHANNKSAL